MRIAPNPNRWLIACAATVVMLTIGAIYSWAIFTQPLLVAYGWDLTTTTWAYAIANFSLAAVGAVIGGFWQDRVGPRTVAMAGVALWGCGNVLAGLGTSVFGAPWLYVSYGVLGGIGAGMAYITPVSMVTKWFPDKKGLAGGLVHELMPALAAVAVILLCCGGGFGTMPSFNAACLGTKFIGLNYGLILSAWGCAGLIGPIVAARASDMTGSFAGMLPLIAVVLMISVVLPFITKKPAQGVPTAESTDRYDRCEVCVRLWPVAPGFRATFNSER